VGSETQKEPVNYLKLTWLTLLDLLKQIVSLPRLVADAVKQRKAQAIARLLEEERLDRIRNPSKYLGKQ
jgi:hypothetical protein